MKTFAIRFKSISMLALLGLLLATAFAGGQTKEREVYPAPEMAPIQIKAALDKASKAHKRIILDFGGNWCGDCKTLDKLFHQPSNAMLLNTNFILVDVNIGKVDKNLEIAKKYGVPLEKGVPALAVLDSEGRVLFSQKQGEFEAMSRMDPISVTNFLNHWRKK